MEIKSSEDKYPEYFMSLSSVNINQQTPHC
jgi:hypothetical protein